MWAFHQAGRRCILTVSGTRRCRIIKEDELVEEILAQLDWTEFDDARFDKTVERVAVFDDRIEVEVKDAMSA